MGEMKIDVINSALVTEVIAIRVGMAFFGVPTVPLRRGWMRPQ
jgi:hypothetical protein